jgi:hypothetical protein
LNVCLPPVRVTLAALLRGLEPADVSPLTLLAAALAGTAQWLGALLLLGSVWGLGRRGGAAHG